MMQDFSNTFEGKQAIRIKAVRFTGNRMLKKMTGIVLTSSMVLGIIVCVFFGFQVRNGLGELAGKQVSKIELIRLQQGLYEKRQELFTQNNIERAAAELELFNPTGRQLIKHF